MSATPHSRFTLDVLRWQPWLETVDEVGATPEQAALVDEVAPSAESRPYYALLAHDAPALRERTALFNAVMYGHGGARRADRELAAVATSLVLSPADFARTIGRDNTPGQTASVLVVTP